MKFSSAAVSVAIVTVAISSWLYGTTAYVKRQSFNNWNTESHGLIVPKDEKFDIVFLGTSRARRLSRYANHLRTEKILQSKVLNLSRDGGAGVSRA